MTAATALAAAAATLAALGMAELAAARHGRAVARVNAARRRRLATSLVALLERLDPRAGGAGGAARTARAGGTRRAGRTDRAGPAGLDARLEAAGLALPAADFALLRAGAAAAGLLAVLPLVWAAPGRAGLVLLLAGPAGAHLAPAAWLARRTRRRAAAVERELADVLDLLRVAVGAGLTPLRAVGEVGRRHPGVLARELRRTAARRSLGLPVADVLAELERRTPGEGVAALCSALRRADRHGAPLAGALGAQARDARSRAAARTTEAAARAAPRIQLVVALVLVPSVLALVAAALLPAMVGW